MARSCRPCLLRPPAQPELSLSGSHRLERSPQCLRQPIGRLPVTLDQDGVLVPQPPRSVPAGCWSRYRLVVLVMGLSFGEQPGALVDVCLLPPPEIDLSLNPLSCCRLAGRVIGPVPPIVIGSPQAAHGT